LRTLINGGLTASTQTQLATGDDAVNLPGNAGDGYDAGDLAQVRK
jgi:hypothetical protein